jgi:hypothetical protein
MTSAIRLRRWRRIFWNYGGNDRGNLVLIDDIDAGDEKWRAKNCRVFHIGNANKMQFQRPINSHDPSASAQSLRGCLIHHIPSEFELHPPPAGVI